MEKIDPKRYYTAEEAGKYLRVQRDTVKKQIREGKLKGKKQGGRQQWVVRGDELLRRMKEVNLDPPGADESEN
jgi:excisionase family DNA binding protein